MDKKKTVPTIAAVVAVVACGTAFVLYRFSHPGRPAPILSGRDIYYTGPMRSKGNPNIWGVDGGARVQAPPDAAPVAGAGKKVTPGAP